MSRKLIIQIPCFNEEETLPRTLPLLPRTVPGVDKVEIMIINDGSRDETVEVAKRLGVDHILDLGTNRGLAHAFQAGIYRAAQLGADYVVNIDADNQYRADDIPKIVAPLISDQADLVVGERPIRQIQHFGLIKKLLQGFGSYVVRRLSGTDVKDSPSGFRALNRQAMVSLCIFNRYTYTHESLLSAANIGLRIKGVPIGVNAEVLRPSRLMKSMVQYIVKGMGTILRFYAIYNPFPIFMMISVVTGFSGLALFARFFYFYFSGHGDGWTQSLIVASSLLTCAVVSFSTAVICDILSVKRQLLQKVLVEARLANLNQDTRFAALEAWIGGSSGFFPGDRIRPHSTHDQETSA